MKSLLFLAFVLAACGSNESSDKDDKTTESADITEINLVEEPQDGLVKVSFEAAYSNLAEIEAQGMVAAVVVAQGSVVPAQCTASYVYKPIAHSFMLEPGAVYSFRACLYNASTHTFSDGVGGTFQTSTF